MGSFIILVTVLAFIAGKIRNELALTLLGTVFLVILIYCFLGVFLLGIIHRRKALSLSMTLISDTIDVGKEAELLIKNGGGDESSGKYFFWKLPAILFRCELYLETRDGRVIRHYTDPSAARYGKFPVKERGAYFSGLHPGACDKFIVFDAPGFFGLSLPLAVDKGPRLLAVPLPAEEPVSFSIRSGGREQRSEPHYRKSDELIDHRPYIPGDDPRRINWKLYSHAHLGELFVREGEPEPPPHSQLLILIDTEADSSLYALDEGRRAVDLLCENALAAALEFSAHGIDILVGSTGGGIIGGKEESGPVGAAEIASALAWPAAIPWPHAVNAEYPVIPNDRSVLVLALPREVAEPSALDRFLKKRDPKQGIDIVFIYDVEGRQAALLEESANICVNNYNGRSGVHAGKAVVSPTKETG